MLEKQQILNEQYLLQWSIAGDQIAFRHLIELYHQLVWHMVCVLGPGHASAEDVLQEIWIDVWRGLPGFQHEKAFRPWLLTIVVNRCRKTSRRPRLLLQPFDILDPEQLVAVDDDLLEYWLHKETTQELQARLMELPQTQQRVLELRYFADLELSEIALVMGTSVGTVKSRLHRALRRLRALLHPS